jgi:hypothetical protein
VVSKEVVVALSFNAPVTLNVLVPEMWVIAEFRTVLSANAASTAALPVPEGVEEAVAVTVDAAVRVVAAVLVMLESVMSTSALAFATLIWIGPLPEWSIVAVEVAVIEIA